MISIFITIYIFYKRSKRMAIFRIYKEFDTIGLHINTYSHVPTTFYNRREQDKNRKLEKRYILPRIMLTQVKEQCRNKYYNYIKKHS